MVEPRTQTLSSRLRVFCISSQRGARVVVKVRGDPLRTFTTTLAPHPRSRPGKGGTSWGRVQPPPLTHRPVAPTLRPRSDKVQHITVTPNSPAPCTTATSLTNTAPPPLLTTPTSPGTGPGTETPPPSPSGKEQRTATAAPLAHPPAPTTSSAQNAPIPPVPTPPLHDKHSHPPPPHLPQSERELGSSPTLTLALTALYASTTGKSFRSLSSRGEKSAQNTST
eukprot:3243825-Rhodomonas_salina.2